MDQQPAHHAVTWKYPNLLGVKNGTTKWETNDMDLHDRLLRHPRNSRSSARTLVAGNATVCRPRLEVCPAVNVLTPSPEWER
jgi:hypothetical protein